MSGTVCCYKGCSKSYSADKDVVNFFKFPEEPKRRKKWMENCSNPELAHMNDRQLRLKRVCSDHFTPLSFMSAETRNQLTEKAVPLSQKEHEAAKAVAATKASEVTLSQKRRGPGRPPRASMAGAAVPVVKKDLKNAQAQETKVEEDGDEEDEEEDDGDEGGGEDNDGEEESGSDDEEYAPPPNVKRQVKQEGDDPVPQKPKGRPPKAKSSLKVKKDKEVKVKSKLVRKKSTTVRKMADLSVIDDVVNEVRARAELEERQELEVEKNRKRNRSSTDQRILKRRRSSGDPDLDNSDDEFDEDDDFDDEEDEDSPERANREFEKFKELLKNAITLPRGWGMGGVIWDPLNRTKVIAASEFDVMVNGLIRFKRAVQIFEDSSVRITVDGIDMTLNFGVKFVSSEADVEEIINRVANCKVCCGVSDFEQDDMIYLPYAKKRGCNYYSEACPVIITKEDAGSVCSPCVALQCDVQNRKEKEILHSENRKTRPVLHNLNHQFGKSLYGLLHEILDDAEALKSDRKQDREAILSKYSNELNVMNGDITKHEKLPHVSVSVDEVSASFQDIVSRLGFAAPGTSSSIRSPVMEFKPDVKSIKIKSSQQSVKRDDGKKKETSTAAKIKKKTSFPSKSTSSVKITNHVDKSKAVPVSASTNSVNFALSDGQEYELIGEVEGNEVVQVVEMNKDSKTEAIEIIEVDDETMAKITAQNAGMFFQNTGSGGAIQVAALDPSDPNLSQILKAMNSSQEFKST